MGKYGHQQKPNNSDVLTILTFSDFPTNKRFRHSMVRGKPEKKHIRRRENHVKPLTCNEPKAKNTKKIEPKKFNEKRAQTSTPRRTVRAIGDIRL